jgi:plastocyanin
MKRSIALAFAVAAVAALAVSVAGTAAAKPSSSSTSRLTILVKSDDEHAKKGPDGKWHDAFLPANPVVRAGVNTRITFVNYDGGAHSMIAPGLGLNVQIPAAKGSTPGRITITLSAKKAGSYDWWCGSPCDPWAMTHNAYMRGSIRVTA